MGVGRREGLRRACQEGGWSYAVFWKAVGGADPVHLIWEDGHCESTFCSPGLEVPDAQHAELCDSAVTRVFELVKKTMASQVHILGEGVIGRAALSGKYQWILCDNFYDSAIGCKDAAGINLQLLAGIKTVVVIPVLPHGVLQLGSIYVVSENTVLVLHAKRLCSQSNNRYSGGLPNLTPGSSKKLDNSKSSINMKNAGGTEALLSTRVLSDVMDFPVCPSPKEDSRVTSFMNLHRRNQSDRGSRLPDVRLCERTATEIAHDRSHNQPLGTGSGSSDCLRIMNKPLSSDGPLDSVGCSPSKCDATGALLRSLVCYNANNGIKENSGIMQFHPRGDVINCVSSIQVSNEVQNDLENLHIFPDQQMFDGMLHGSQESSQYQFSFPFRIPCALPPVEEACSAENYQVHGISAASSRPDLKVCCNDLTSRISDCSGMLMSSNASFDNTRLRGRGNNNESILSPIPMVKPLQQLSGSLGFSFSCDLFDVMGKKSHQLCDNLDSILISQDNLNDKSSDADAAGSFCPESRPIFDTMDGELSHSGIFSLADADQLLDAVVSNAKSAIKQNSDDSTSCKTSLTDGHNSCNVSSLEMKSHGLGGVALLARSNMPALSFVKEPSCSSRKDDCANSQTNGVHKSQIRLWIESGQNLNCDSASASSSKGSDIANKPTRKRSRPGENPKPRPKDRQLIQDRIKELREIVPNGAKCSIDGLLEKTIKHMLFLQSVAKHADRLKEPAESKDYFDGGATWAFEVGSQSMTCPIIVEDLDRPRQMLVEMICEDRGIFLEIADFVRGLGLTILKGVMEVRRNKIWGRFTVEANRDISRMEIFLSLAHFLEPLCVNSSNSTGCQQH